MSPSSLAFRFHLAAQCCLFGESRARLLKPGVSCSRKRGSKDKSPSPLVTKGPHPAVPKCPESRCWETKGAQLLPKEL